MDYHLISDLFYLNASLPDIRIGEPVELSHHDLTFLIAVNLNQSDRRQIDVIRRYYDLQNARYLWMGQPLDPYGTLNQDELEDALVTGIGIPDYLFDFVEKYEEKDERLNHFPQVISRYFETEIARTRGFIRDYLIFERDWRLVFAALRAKTLGRDPLVEFQYEDPNEDIVAQIIAQKDSKTYEPPARYEPIKSLYENYADNPTELYQALAHYRFSVIDERLGVEMTSLERVIGYLIQLIIAEKWLALDKQKGKEILESVVEEKS